MKFFKLLLIILAGLAVLGGGFFIILQAVERDGQWEIEEFYSEDGTVSCYIGSDGGIVISITDPGDSVWRYDSGDSTEKLTDSKADFDGYHFMIEPSHEEGTGCAVVAEYEETLAGSSDAGEPAGSPGLSPGGSDPVSYGIVRFTIESNKVTGIPEVIHKEVSPDGETLSPFEPGKE